MAGEVFRSLSFPKAVDAANAKAEYQNGMLNIGVGVNRSRVAAHRVKCL
ncbi:MAG: Hsp20/alpha crystallin family protein [Acidobacteriia bacterium]|nr:Hsp20/alpha crystallin family protein [Terriglobia bacterium]